MWKSLSEFLKESIQKFLLKSMEESLVELLHGVMKTCPKEFHKKSLGKIYPNHKEISSAIFGKIPERIPDCTFEGMLENF